MSISTEPVTTSLHAFCSLKDRNARIAWLWHPKNPASGASAVEFALILPLILLIAAALMNAGMLMWQIQLVLEGGRHSARLATSLSNYPGMNNCSSLKTEAANANNLYHRGKTQNGSQISGGSGIKNAQWKSLSEVEDIDQVEAEWAGKPFPFLSVTRQTEPNASCVLCFGGVWENLRRPFPVIFPIEGSLTRSGPC